jgi:protein-S-isoprenylcysteine O-methyltransferase Ste14
MSTATSERAARGTAWAMTAFYLLVVLEFFYMASPFAAYFYAAYLPGLETLARHASTAWLTTFFLPHFAPSSSLLVRVLPGVGIVLTAAGLLGFAVGAVQVYSRKLRRRGAATGGLYRFVRHPQYACLMVAGAGMLLLWPRHLMVILFVTMLFAYRGLAWLEERECLRRYGAAYAAYQASTPRFLPRPWRRPAAAAEPAAAAAAEPAAAAAAEPAAAAAAEPAAAAAAAVASTPPRRAWPGRVLRVVVAYAGALALALAAAGALHRHTIRHLFVHYSDSGVTIALAPRDGPALPAIAARAASDPRVAPRLESARTGGARLIAYAMPWEWTVPEIPMTGVVGHHTPAVAPGRTKVVYTRTRPLAPQLANGPDLVRATTRTEPVLEAWLEADGRVARVVDPPARPFYGTVPVPIF